MKLSKKGTERLCNTCFIYDFDIDTFEHLDNDKLEPFEFKQDDFKEAILLSKEESDRIIEALIATKDLIEDDDKAQELKWARKLLAKRYKQAELNK